jgi:two-component system chemotaxis response regulator CheV
VARKEIVSVLDKLGVKYAQANDGLEAWEKLKANGRARWRGTPSLEEVRSS